MVGCASGTPLVSRRLAAAARNTWYPVAPVAAFHTSEMLFCPPVAMSPATCAGSVNALASVEFPLEPAALFAFTT